jgi:hypothetical protein
MYLDIVYDHVCRKIYYEVTFYERERAVFPLVRKSC